MPLSSTLFRVDRFRVPAGAAAEFMNRVREVDRLLSQMRGCRQNLVLEQPREDGSVAVVTLVEWESEEALAAAQSAMRSRYAREAFDPASFMRRLGVEPDLGTYRRA